MRHSPRENQAGRKARIKESYLNTVYYTMKNGEIIRNTAILIPIMAFMIFFRLLPRKSTIED